jgi:ADP-ribose pyrophosphatase
MPRARCLKRSTIYRGRVIRLVRDVLDIDGRRFARETILHPGAVVVVPVLDQGRVVLVRQYRRAVDRVLLELPAGTLEPGERRDVCAKRELVEETGWRARSVRRLGRFYAAPGFLSEEMTVFLATGLTQSVASPEPDELVRPVVMTLSAALSKVNSGAIRDAKTIIGLWLAERHLESRK